MHTLEIVGKVGELPYGTLDSFRPEFCVFFRTKGQLLCLRVDTTVPTVTEKILMSSLSHRVSRFASLSAESGADAAVTIAARTFGLLQPGGTHAPEATRMVEEKVVAAYEGAFGASMAWGAFLFASAWRGGATAAQLSHALIDVAEAAAGPARRKVRANARRLSKRAH
jgi:hypothetical protein